MYCNQNSRPFSNYDANLTTVIAWGSNSVIFTCNVIYSVWHRYLGCQYDVNNIKNFHKILIYLFWLLATPMLHFRFSFHFIYRFNKIYNLVKYNNKYGIQIAQSLTNLYTEIPSFFFRVIFGFSVLFNKSSYVVYHKTKRSFLNDFNFLKTFSACQHPH